MTSKANYSFIASLFIHVMILVFFIVSFEWNSAPPVLENSDKNIINAMILDAPKKPILPSKSIISEPKKPELKPEPTPPKVVEPPKTIPLPEPQPTPKAIIEKKLPPPPPPPEKKIVIPDQTKKKELVAKNLLDDMKQSLNDKKKLKQKEIEAAFQKELKMQAATALQQQLLQEKNKLSHTLQSQQAQGEVNKYKALILQAISQHWLIPGPVNKQLTCELFIRIAPGGMVLDAEVVKSSGDVALDRSARAAVFKASPLPVPTDREAFESFKQFILKVKPENVVL